MKIGTFLKKTGIFSLIFVVIFSFIISEGKAGEKKKLNLVIGSGESGFIDGVKHKAEFRRPYSAVAFKDKLYVTDSGNHCIRQIDLLTGKVSTYTGAALNTQSPEEMIGYKDSTKSLAQFNRPMGITVDDKGALYIADFGNHSIRKIKDGYVFTFAGNGREGYADGKGGNAGFNSPIDLAFMHGDLYVSDSKNKAIRKISTDGTVSTVLQGGDLIEPSGLYADNGILYIVDSGAQALFAYSPKDGVKLVAGANTRLDEHLGCRTWGNTDGDISQAKFNFPAAVYVEKNNIYVSDTWNSSIRKISGRKVSTWLFLRNGEFIPRPTKMIFLENEIFIVDILNHQLLFYSK